MTTTRTPEYTEVVAGTPDFLMSKIKTAPDWVHKAVSHVYHDSEHHEGDGGEGSISTYHLHENHAAGGGFLSMKLHMEVFDEATHSYVCSLQGDPRYDHLKLHVSFLPGPSAGTSMVELYMDYVPVNDDTPPPDHVAASVLLVLKEAAAHFQVPSLENPKPETSADVVAHPETPASENLKPETTSVPAPAT